MEPAPLGIYDAKCRIPSHPHHAAPALHRPRRRPLPPAQQAAPSGLGWGWDKGPQGQSCFQAPFPLGVETSYGAWRERQPAQPTLLILASSWTASQPRTWVTRRTCRSVGCAEWEGAKGLASQGVRQPRAGILTPSTPPRPFQLQVPKQRVPLSLAFIKTKGGNSQGCLNTSSAWRVTGTQ